MKNQYEQKCNAESLKKMGVPVIYDLSYDNVKIINDWIKSEQIINVDYSESPKKVINKMLKDYIKKISTEQLIYKFNTDLK